MHRSSICVKFIDTKLFSTSESDFQGPTFAAAGLPSVCILSSANQDLRARRVVSDVVERVEAFSSISYVFGGRMSFNRLS